MKNITTALLILILFPLELTLTICTLTIYLLVMEYGDGLLTKQLINKLN